MASKTETKELLEIVLAYLQADRSDLAEWFVETALTEMEEGIK